MPMLRRLSVALLVMWMVWPVSSHAQAVKAGVISTVSGKVTAIRAGLAQPLPLKFKDDVFLQDRIATGEQSLARVLLGGKALVTIRELSVLTITEVPGQATINLESGKIGLAVARDRMRPGESIEVRTPNAVAAVRGTVLITETDRAAGQIPRTAMYLTSDPTGRGVGITHLDPATGRAIALEQLVGVKYTEEIGNTLKSILEDDAAPTPVRFEALRSLDQYLRVNKNDPDIAGPVRSAIVETSFSPDAASGYQAPVQTIKDIARETL